MPILAGLDCQWAARQPALGVVVVHLGQACRNNIRTGRVACGSAERFGLGLRGLMFTHVFTVRSVQMVQGTT